MNIYGIRNNQSGILASLHEVPKIFTSKGRANNYAKSWLQWSDYKIVTFAEVDK